MAWRQHTAAPQTWNVGFGVLGAASCLLFLNLFLLIVPLSWELKSGLFLFFFY